MPDHDEFIFCIFSYNRYKYLKNLIHSIETFYPDVKTAVFDNNSDQQQLLDYYSQLEKNQNYILIRQNTIPGEESKHGGLYTMMNRALRYSWDLNCSFAFFIQDDMQFVQQADLSAQSRHYFDKWPNALMLSPLFMQKIFLPEIDSYIISQNGDYLFRNYGIADVGIIDLQRAKTAALEFNALGEKFNGQKYFNMGYQLLLSHDPCLAWVPWAVNYKDKVKKGMFIYNPAQLYLKPLGQDSRQKLAESQGIPFLEDYTRLNTWWVPKPYIHLLYNFKQVLGTYFRYWKWMIFKK